MNLNELIKIVDFNESIIIEIGNDKKDAYIIIEEPYEIELIANGYRPSFDMAPRHKIVFKNESFDFKFKGYEPVLECSINDVFRIITKKFELSTDCDDIELIPNYDFDSRI